MSSREVPLACMATLARMLLIAAAAACAAARAGEPAPASAPSTPDAAQVQQAINEIADAGLSTTRTVKRLRMKQQAQQQQQQQPQSPSWRWLADLGRWLSSSARLLLLALLAVTAVFALLRLRDWLQARRARARPAGPQAPPTHVADLDIRIESLPADPGAAARALWAQGQPRAALSLLYRAALSRLVHTHGVAIRAASTEGECLTLAQWKLPAPAGEFVGRLVDAWQRCVYGARLPEPDAVMALCDGFESHLGPPSSGKTPA